MAARLICEDSKFFISDALAPEVLSLLTSTSGTGVTFEYESCLANSSSRFSGPGKKVFSLSHTELKRLPHELVSECWGITETDERLDKISFLRDHTDVLTPDRIELQDDGSWVVTEIKTSRTNRGIDKVFTDTKNKYYEALERRINDKDITFCIICVCPDGVCSNVTLPTETVDSLVAHYLFGMYLQDAAKKFGWNPEKEFDGEIELRASLSEIKLDTDSIDCRGNNEPLHITQSMKEAWDRIPYTPAHKIFGDNIIEMRQDWMNMLSNEGETAGVTIMDFDNRTNDLIRRINEKGSTTRVKPIIRHPIVAVKSYSEYKSNWRFDELPQLLINSNSTYGGLWSDAIIEAMNSAEGFEEILSVEAEKEIEEKGFWTSPLDTVSKSKRYVIKLPLHINQRIDLADRGVQAKALRNDPTVAQKVSESKKSLKFDTEVDDIASSFDLAEDWCEPFGQTLYPVERKLDPLIKTAARLSGDVMSPENEIFVKLFSSSKIGRALILLNEIVSEVNISRLKTLRKDCFIMKRLPNHRAFLLIKTTSTDKQIFYSLMIPKTEVEDHLSVSESLIDIGDAYCTKFVSLDRHKITHLLYCTYKMASLRCFWDMQFSDKTDDVQKRARRARTHFWISMLVYLEDKEKTSSSLQLIRYAYMEVIKGGLIRMDPGKIFGKIDPVIRSRLLLFCIRKIICNFRLMCENPPKITRDVAGRDALASGDRVGELLSWVDGKTIKNFEVALNLSYLGVLHNKEEGDLIHGYLKIFDKVIDQEIKLKNSRIAHMTTSECTSSKEMRDHEFSAAAVKSFATATKEFLKRKHGDYDAWIEGTLSHVLLRRSFTELATSKASADEFPDEDPQDIEEEISFNKVINSWKAGKLGETPRPSLKCVENIYNLLLEMDIASNKPFLYMKQFLASVEASGGISVKLFKKLQIGGTREIFILPIKTRIIVNFLETICRAICDDLPVEMLTKGDQKISRSDEHFRKKTQLMAGKIAITAINSDDAQTWAQRFVMPVFGVMLNTLLPEPFLNPCLRVLNLITSKRLVLPTELLRLFHCHKSTMSFNDNMTHLKSEYLQTNVSERLLLPQGGNLMTNRSNMMQGILHYTSSLLHSCYMTAFCAYADMTVNVSKAFKCIDRGLFTSKVSSDDSSLIMSISLSPSETPEKDLRVSTMLLSMFSYLKAYCYPLFCSKQSWEKSTLCNMNLVEEFNSIWFFRNTLLAPSIKFVAAAIRTHVTDKFELRQNVMYGLRSQVLENTGSIRMTSVVMSCQLRAHYIALGVISNPLFPYLRQFLLTHPHPAIGFFLTEHHLVAGLLGQKYNLFNACERSESSSRMTKILMGSAMLSLEDQNYGITSISITQGSRTRYNRMLTRMQVSYEDIINYYDNHPEELFRHSKNPEEIKKEVALKASTPSMSNAFEFLTDSKQHAASSYILQSPCVFTRERISTTFDEATGKSESVYEDKKMSLCGLCLRLTSDANQSEPLEAREFQLLFPNYNLYRDVNGLIVTAMTYSEMITQRERKIYLSMNIPKYGVTFLARPSAAASRKWFNLDTKFTSYEVEQTWSLMKNLIPWLKDSFNETYLNSPLGSAVTISQFIRSLPTDFTSIRVLAPAYKKPVVFDTLREIVLKSQWPGIILGPPVMEIDDDYETKPKKTRTTSPIREYSYMRPKKNIVNAIATALWYEAALPADVRERHAHPQTVRKIFEDSPTILTPAEAINPISYSQMSSQEATLAIIQHVVKTGTTNITTVLQCAKRGLVGHFTKRATYNEAKEMYEGDATFLGTYNGIVFELESRDEVITCLTVRSKENVKTLLYGGGFLSLMRDLRCKLDNRAPEPSIFYRSSRDYADLRNGELQRIPKRGHVPVAYRDLDPVRLTGTKAKVRFDGDCIRVVDSEEHMKGNKKYRRKHTILSYRPRRPKDITALEGFTPKLRAQPNSSGLRVDPYEAWIAQRNYPAQFHMSLIKDCLSIAEDRYDSLYPGFVDWVKKSLRARAESIADVIPSSVAIYESIHGTSMEVDRPLLNVSGEEENMDDFFEIGEDDIDYSVLETMCSEKAGNPDELVEPDDLAEEGDFPSVVSWVDAIEDVDFSEYTSFRPSFMSDNTTALKFSSFWDPLLEMLKRNSDINTRSQAFKGVYYEGSSEFVELIAKLFGAIEPANIAQQVPSGTSIASSADW